MEDKAKEKKVYEKPIIKEVKLEGEDGVLGACMTISTACGSYQY